MEEVKNIFRENPSRSFRMNKNSSTAAKLKASITDKLNQFLVNYTDDVLAEYIVVLICNGKDQNQAKDHLEAFLGDRSAEFVSWLWDLLLKYVDNSKKLAVGKNKDKLRMLRGLHNHVQGDANTLPNDEHEYIPSAFAPQPVSSVKNEVSEGSQHCSQGSDTSLNEIKMKRQKQSFKFPEKSRSTEYNPSEVSKYAHSEVKVSSGVSAISEQSMIPVNENKIISNYQNHQRISLPKYERPSSNLRSITKEKSKYGLPAGTGVTENQFSPRPIDIMSRKSDTRQLSVWDRLGRKRDVTRITGVHNINEVKRRIVEHLGEAHYKPAQFSSGARSNENLKRELSASNIRSATVISNTSNDDDDKRLVYDLSPVNKTDRKRQFNDIDSAEESKYLNLHYTKPLKEFKRVPSAKYSSTECLNSISSGTRQTKLLQTCPDVSPNNDDDDKTLEYDPSPVDKTNRKRQCSEIGSAEESKYRHLQYTGPLKQFEQASSAKCTSTKSLNDFSFGTRQTELLQAFPDVSYTELKGEALDSAKTNVKPVQSQLLDMKLRLHQIEMQMSKLKSRQLESNESKTKVLSNSGAFNHSDEDVESRTVFVTNVHFAATKESLSLHFSKCGMIVDIILLNELKGAAYITFLQKEAADKAVALSGTSFWSRTLKIVRKKDVPMLAPFFLALPRPNTKLVFPRRYGGSLQWRRDQVVNTGSSNHALTYGLEGGSETVQQTGNDSERPITAKEEEVSTDETQDKMDPKETQEVEKCHETGDS